VYNCLNGLYKFFSKPRAGKRILDGKKPLEEVVII